MGQTNETIENIIIELILNAGESKTYAMDALRNAKESNWAKVEQLLEGADRSAKKAHDAQTQLIGLNEGENKIPVSLIMAHAQDHVMTAMLARELVIEFIDLYKKMS